MDARSPITITVTIKRAQPPAPLTPAQVERFHQFIVDHNGFLNAVCTNMCRNAELPAANADDLAQDVRLALFRHWHRYDNKQVNGKGLIVVSARNRLRDLLTTQSRRPATTPLMDESEHLTDPDPYEPLLPHCPFDDLLFAEDCDGLVEGNDIVRYAMNSIPDPDARRIAYLAWLEGMTYAQIATRERISKGTISAHIKAARSAVEDAFARIGLTVTESAVA